MLKFLFLKKSDKDHINSINVTCKDIGIGLHRFRVFHNSHIPLVGSQWCFGVRSVPRFKPS